MKTYYRWRYAAAYANANFGRTGYELRGEGSRMDSKRNDARTWRITSTKPEEFDFGDVSALVICRARATSIKEARSLPEESWK